MAFYRSQCKHKLPKKIGDLEYIIDADSSNGMNVPVKIFSDEKLLSKIKVVLQLVTMNQSLPH